MQIFFVFSVFIETVQDCQFHTCRNDVCLNAHSGSIFRRRSSFSVGCYRSLLSAAFCARETLMLEGVAGKCDFR